MHKEYGAYLSLEGSFVLPIVLAIYYLIIVGAMTLFMRCIDDSTSYIGELHEARFGNDSSIKEAIYEEMYDYLGMTNTGVYYINPLRKLEDRDEY